MLENKFNVHVHICIFYKFFDRNVQLIVLTFRFRLRYKLNIEKRG